MTYMTGFMTGFNDSTVHDFSMYYPKGQLCFFLKHFEYQFQAQNKKEDHGHTHARTRNMAIFARRAWYVLFYKIFTGILCLFVFFPVFLFRFCFCSSIFVSFLFLFRFFCFVFVFVPVKRTPRIKLRAWVCPQK